MPEKEGEREAYACRVVENGFALLDWLERADAPSALKELSQVETLRQAWACQYERTPLDGEGGARTVRYKQDKELPRATDGLESPYDPEARFRKRHSTKWRGYIVHVSESCEEEEVHLITHVETTLATVHEAQCTETIHQALVDKGLPPQEHMVDSAYIDAALLVNSQQELEITLVGPTRPNGSWQARQEEAYDQEQFEIDWVQKQVCCPQGKLSAFWGERIDGNGMPYVAAIFSQSDCRVCTARHLCTKSKTQGRRLKIQPRAEYEFLQQARERHTSPEGKLLYNRRAGIEGTISQGIRAYDLRQTSYFGLAKTHLQHVATAAAINIDRLFNWFEQIPLSKTRTSRFAALAV